MQVDISKLALTCDSICPGLNGGQGQWQDLQGGRKQEKRKKYKKGKEVGTEKMGWETRIETKEERACHLHRGPIKCNTPLPLIYILISTFGVADTVNLLRFDVRLLQSSTRSNNNDTIRLSFHLYFLSPLSHSLLPI